MIHWDQPDYDLAKVPDHAAPPAIALDAGNSTSNASTFAFDTGSTNRPNATLACKENRPDGGRISSQRFLFVYRGVRYNNTPCSFEAKYERAKRPSVV